MGSSKSVKKPEQATRLLPPKKWLLLVPVLIVAIAGYLFIASLSKPAKGVIAASQAPAQPASQPLTWLVQTGKYADFEYPSDFDAKPADKATGLQLETFKYVKNPWPFWNMTDTVSSLPGSSLSDNADYNLRQVLPAKYQHEKWDINGSSVDVFSYQGGQYEKTAFIAHQGKLWTVDINSADTESSAKLDSIMRHVLGSVRWVN